MYRLRGIRVINFSRNEDHLEFGTGLVRVNLDARNVRKTVFVDEDFALSRAVASFVGKETDGFMVVCGKEVFY